MQHTGTRGQDMAEVSMCNFYKNFLSRNESKLCEIIDSH